MVRRPQSLSEQARGLAWPRVMRALRDAGRALGPDGAILCAELLFFQPVAPLRPLLRALWADRLSRLAPHFDPPLYLMQIASPWRRRWAARDPLLHYALMGWRERRLPNARLDPRFVDHQAGPGRAAGEPLNWLLSQAGGLPQPQNEAEAAAACRPTPPTGQGRPAVLIFHHGRGGGSSRYLAMVEARLEAEGFRPVRLRPVTGAGHLVIWPEPDGRHVAYDLRADPDAIVAAALRHDVARLLVSHVIDFDPAIFTLLPRLAADLRVPLWLILHDYFSLCARVNLVDAAGRCCGIAPVPVCARCVSAGGSEIGDMPVEAWRPTFAALVAAADRVIVPSRDARRRLQPSIPQPVHAWCPETDEGRPPVRALRLGPDEPLRVVVLGSLNVAKGSRVVLDLARIVRRTGAPLSLTVIGEAENGAALRAAGVAVTGRYRGRELRALIERTGAHVAFLPAIWPETWSFVLSEALDLGLTVVAFAHGAPAERLVALGRTDTLLPLRLVDQPEAMLEAFLRMRRGWSAPLAVAACAAAQA